MRREGQVWNPAVPVGPAKPGSLDLKHQFWPVQRDPESIQHITAKQNERLFTSGQDLDRMGGHAPKLDLNQECWHSQDVAAATKCFGLTELVQLQLLHDPPRNH